MSVTFLNGSNAKICLPYKEPYSQPYMVENVLKQYLLNIGCEEKHWSIFEKICLSLLEDLNASKPGFILGHSPDFSAASNPSVRHWNCRGSESESSHLCSWEPVTHTDLYFTPLLTCFSVHSCCFPWLTFINMEVCYASTCITGTVDGNCEDSVHYFQINSKSNCCCPCYVRSWLGVPFV